MRTALLGALVIASLWPAMELAKESEGIDFQDDFGHSLADAPLTTEERAQIYDVVDAGLHGVFASDQLEREAVLSARVDSIKLARRGPEQIFVRVSRRMCGATGNCEMFVLVRQRGKLKLVLEANGYDLNVERITHHGFHDIVVPHNYSAWESTYTAYRWNGREYERAGCHMETLDRDDSGKPPVISGC